MEVRGQHHPSPRPRGKTLDSEIPKLKPLVSGSYDGIVKLWDMTTGCPILIDSVQHPDVVYGVSFSPDGTELATACACGYFRIPLQKSLCSRPGLLALAVFRSVSRCSARPA